MENKKQQKNLITEIMNEDQKDGLYNQTATEWLAEKYNYVFWLRNRDEISSEQGDAMRAKYLEEAKQMEKEQKNTLPIHIHEGVENVWVYIEDGIVNVKHYDEFNVDKAKEGLNFAAIKFNPAKLKLDAEK